MGRPHPRLAAAASGRRPTAHASDQTAAAVSNDLHHHRRRPPLPFQRRQPVVLHHNSMSALRPNQRERASSRAGATGGPPTSHPNGILNGIIDPTKTGKYPVILSDTLRGGTQTDVFTAVRCELSSRSTLTIVSQMQDTTQSRKTLGIHPSFRLNETDRQTRSQTITNPSNHRQTQRPPRRG